MSKTSGWCLGSDRFASDGRQPLKSWNRWSVQKSIFERRTQQIETLMGRSSRQRSRAAGFVSQDPGRWSEFEEPWCKMKHCFNATAWMSPFTAAVEPHYGFVCVYCTIPACLISLLNSWQIKVCNQKCGRPTGSNRCPDAWRRLTVQTEPPVLISLEEKEVLNTHKHVY